MFKIVRFAFILIMLSMLLAIYFYGLSLWWLLIPPLVYLFILFLGTVRIGMKFFMPAIIHGSRQKKQVVLTFDDGPDRYTTQVADCLNRHGVKGAFFLIGKKVEKHPEMVKKLVEEGHVVGNHGFYHQWNYPLKMTKNIQREMQMTSSAIEAATGTRTRFFRPPFGITNPRLARAVQREKMLAIGWDVRSFDTVLGTSSKFASRLKRKVSNGSIILLHDTGEGMVRFLDMFIPWLKIQGYEIISLESLINEKAYR